MREVKKEYQKIMDREGWNELEACNELSIPSVDELYEDDEDEDDDED